MASQSKSDAARANGAKSKGPATPEGKARSSQNALKHGLTAQREGAAVEGFDVLPGESQEDFDALLESHQTHYQPSGALEHDLVRTLAITRWRLRRIPTLESNIFDNEMVLAKKKLTTTSRKSTTPAASGSFSRNWQTTARPCRC